MARLCTKPGRDANVVRCPLATFYQTLNFYSPLDLADKLTHIDRLKEDHFESAASDFLPRDRAVRCDDPDRKLVCPLGQEIDIRLRAVARGNIGNEKPGQHIAQRGDGIGNGLKSLCVKTLFDKLGAQQSACVPILSRDQNSSHPLHRISGMWQVARRN